MNGIINIQPIKSEKVTSSLLCEALLSDLGCKVGSFQDNTGKDYGVGWQWFDPSLVEKPFDLPSPWRSIFFAQNLECWKLGYRYVHCPEEIICQYPHNLVKGLFGVVNSSATSEDIKAKDLIHLNGQFVEYDTEDKKIALDWIGYPDS